MQKPRKGLGRGLSALIPEADMDFLTRVARGEVAHSIDRKPKRSTKEKGKAVSLHTPPKSDAGTSKKTPTIEVSDFPTLLETKPVVAKNNNSSINLKNKSQADLLSLSEMILLSEIEANPYQPRRTFSNEEMEELSSSIHQHGVLQPILLRPLPLLQKKDEETKAKKENDGKKIADVIKYQIIAGERRWRASRQAGLTEIPAIIRQVTNQQALELAIIENVQRHDISSLDAANAYLKLAKEFSLSQEEIAKRVGKSRVAISNTIRLLDLSDEIQNSISDGTLTEGHGRAILLASSDGSRRAVFRRVLRDKLSVRATEELARGIMSKSGEVALSESNTDEISASDSKSSARSIPEIRRIEEGLQKHLGTRVRLRPRKRGGQVVIQYFSNEELERLLKVIIKS